MTIVVRHGADLQMRLYIQPRASRDKIIGLHGNALKVAITAPPIDGKANTQLIKYLAKQFKVAKGQVIVEKGELGRHKRVRVIRPTVLPEVIAELLSAH